VAGHVHDEWNAEDQGIEQAITIGIRPEFSGRIPNISFVEICHMRIRGRTSDGGAIPWSDRDGKDEDEKPCKSSAPRDHFSSKFSVANGVGS